MKSKPNLAHIYVSAVKMQKLGLKRPQLCLLMTTHGRHVHGQPYQSSKKCLSINEIS